MIDYLKELRRRAIQFNVAEYCFPVLENECFPTWSGAGKDIHHHYGDGGLLKHTYEVVEFAMTALSTHRYIAGADALNGKELFISAVWHDYGKLWDYQKVDGVWGKHNDHARRIHHISRSAIEWQKFAYSLPYMDDGGKLLGIDIDNITHNILSHHGMREWGSPVAPATKEAWILHLSDNMSARLDDTEKHDRF
jgi:3'-5' exoribonuclease